MKAIWKLLPPAAVTAALGFSRYAYKEAFAISRERMDDPYAPLPGPQYKALEPLIHRGIRAMEKHSYAPVQITAPDGTPLFARYYHHGDGAPVQILFHGYRSSALRDCCGGHALAWKMGFNTLVVDQRGHGGSGGKCITFGIKERHDCLAWAQYAARRFGPDTPIVLSGLSMGAATVLSAAQLPLPEEVVCILADSPYDSPKTIICKVCRDRKLPDRLAWPFIKLGAALYGGFDLSQASAMEAISHARVPILLIHGEDDRLVPCEMSRRLHHACASRCTLCTFPGAGHGLAYMTDPEGYEKCVYGFLATVDALRGCLKGTPITPD